MIWAALFYALYSVFGGSSLSYTGEWLFEQVKPQVLSEIQDSTRAKLVKKEFKEISKEMKEFGKKTKSDAKSFQALIKNVHSKKDEFQILYDQHHLSSEQYIDQVLNQFSKLKSFIKKEEWEAALQKSKVD